MKNLILGAILLFSITSCTPDDICGTVTQTYIGYNESTGQATYYFWIDGNKRIVDTETWINYGVGDQVCLTF